MKTLKTSTLKKYYRSNLLELDLEGNPNYMHSSTCRNYCEYSCNGNYGFNVADQIKEWLMKSKMTKANCIGCEDDFYNDKNPLGVKECWNFPKAKIISRKKVHISQTPPWKQKPGLYPHCYHVRQYVFVEGNREY